VFDGSIKKIGVSPIPGMAPGLYRYNKSKRYEMRLVKPVLTEREIEEIMATEYCDAPVVVDDTPYFMDSIVDIQLSEAEEVECWEDVYEDNIIDFPTPESELIVPATSAWAA